MSELHPREDTSGKAACAKVGMRSWSLSKAMLHGALRQRVKGVAPRLRKLLKRPRDRDGDKTSKLSGHDGHYICKELFLRSSM